MSVAIRIPSEINVDKSCTCRWDKCCCLVKTVVSYGIGLGIIIEFNADRLRQRRIKMVIKVIILNDVVDIVSVNGTDERIRSST